MQEFTVSYEILNEIPAVLGGGMAAGILVVSAVSAFVSGFKALLRMVGGR